MDTTYWGKLFGVMLFKDAYTKENQLKYYVKTETNLLYTQGIKELQSFGKILVQMCQFHQVAIIRKYITKNLKNFYSIDLKPFVAMIKMTDKDPFEGGLANSILDGKCS